MRKKKHRIIVGVLLSGGIDSCALLWLYLRQAFTVRAFFVNFGQPAARQELKAAQTICDYYKIPLSIFTCKGSVDISEGEILGRNAFLIFSAVLMSQIEAAIISIGIHAGTSYYDCGEEFINTVQRIVDGYSAGRIKIAAPFLGWNKRMIWEMCKKYKLPVHLTYSCELGGTHPCGKCLSCKDREALGVL